ncbi:MAG: aquaporin [Kofleriaceae bacterium]
MIESGPTTIPVAARTYVPARRLLAELFGTFMLTLVAAGGPVIAAATGTSPDLAALVVAPALLVMALIYSVGPQSGAHFNPAVTLAFTLRQNFPLRRLPGYWLAQGIGAILAALLLRALFGNVGDLGATLPYRGTFVPFAMEATLTLLLVTVILATSTGHKSIGHNAALAVGATIALDGLFAAPVSGASMNPARSFGPALVGGHLDTCWIYLAGPALGAVIAVGLAWLLRGGPSAAARVAAQGDGP